MSFKENLKKKMQIEHLAKIIAVSTGSPGVPRKIEKEKMRELLSMSPYALEQRRDLELYHRNIDEDLEEVLVLDNELPLYGNTTLDDITLRKSPELKEMISIRNVIKILNDSDIIIGKGREALEYVRDRCLESLDLRYGKQDILDMADEGLEAFARTDSEGVFEMLELFFDILGYSPLPAEVMVNDYIMYGRLYEDVGNGKVFGPVVMYNEKTNALKLIAHRLDIRDPGAQELIPSVALGKMDADKEGGHVFPFLAKLVLSQKGPTIH